MKITITTLVIIEDILSAPSSQGSICYHSFRENPEAAKSEILAAVNQVYAPDEVFESIEQMEYYFPWVSLETQEIELETTKTAIRC